ncbi:MAG: sugar phosphate isomerase/epimerase [Chloroflexi bacterium]|uniref:sugar phosphate isomerase/epimerase family protein n=1 Tax=Candidatus Flexifilum breve TaxID=3140694 RepID=UPI003135657E|nr:sugar phosphate isomerase/epimerase [Chloroflexota bacterium]
MTRLGLGSYGVAWNIGVPGYEQPSTPMDAFGLLRVADELGLRLVQYADNLPLDALSSEEQAQLRDEAQARKISIEVGTRGIQTDHLHRWIELAVYFGSPILRVVVDTKAHHPDPDEVVALVRAVLPALHQADVRLAIENHDRFKARTLAGIIEAVNDPHVGICLDTVNSFGALEGPDVVVAALGRHVVNLHVKEFTVRRVPHNMGFEVTGCPAGQGMLDVPWLLAALRGKSFNAIIETWLAPDASMSATAATELAWVRQSVAYLRTLITD